MGFPADDYTPFGLLANPWAFARSRDESFGGTIRASEQGLGFGWLEPWATHPRRAVVLRLGCGHEDRVLSSWADFAAAGLVCSYHSVNLFEYRWQLGELVYRVRFFADGPDALVAHWLIENQAQRPQRAQLWAAHEAWARSDQPRVQLETLWRSGAIANGSEAQRRVSGRGRPVVERVGGQVGQAISDLHSCELEVPAAGHASWVVAVGRGADAGGAAGRAVQRWREREAELLAEDEAFWATCPQLSGDWPECFRRGFVYDFETTRMCLQPPGGIFRDVWPAWMVNWPRAVLAEGTLDMLRLSFAQPELAQRAVLSLFRDAPAPNVPCVFKHGEPNMVAADGSICGTSPAWCVPFYNLKRLYLRTLDRAWLAELYPYLAAYLRWWLEHRSDEAGWTVYKCTWEAGEDNSPRLDPDRKGDHVISQFARPVELQAAMANAAATLAFFARQLGTDHREWRTVEQTARRRVRQLWDSREGRFRDWDVRRNGFLEPSGRNEYWGTDPCRFSPLALTPLLFDQTTAGQVAALRREIERYAEPPWCEWPSWSYVVLEAASRVGWLGFAGQVAYDIVRRVYAENDRRNLFEFERPMPGAAREYWPTELGQWDASEGYGWGATTASFVVRQLCGFYEADEPLGCAFRLAPAFPPELIEGRELRLGPVPYRGRALQLAYRPGAEGALEIRVELPDAARLRARDERTGQPLLEARPRVAHTFRLARGRAARVELPG